MLILVGFPVEDHQAWEVVIRKRSVRNWGRIFEGGGSESFVELGIAVFEFCFLSFEFREMNQNRILINE